MLSNRRGYSQRGLYIRKKSASLKLKYGICRHLLHAVVVRENNYQSVYVRTHSTRRNDLRAAIPMQIFTRLNAVRLLILRRHFGSLWEDRRRRTAAEGPSPCVDRARLPRRPPAVEGSLSHIHM